jgi:hypothetical protein
MILIWSGLGYLVLPIVVLTPVPIAMLAEFLLTHSGHDALASAAMAIGVLASAALNWVIGRRLNGKTPPYLLTREPHAIVVHYRRHKFLWLPMQYWSVPVAAVGLVMLIAQAGEAALPSLLALVEHGVR